MYISKKLVVICLADKECPVEERKAVATALADTPRPELFVLRKPYLLVDFWPESEKMPSLTLSVLAPAIFPPT